jgi:hypothetical protein
MPITKAKLMAKSQVNVRNKEQILFKYSRDKISEELFLVVVIIEFFLISLD